MRIHSRRLRTITYEYRLRKTVAEAARNLHEAEGMSIMTGSVHALQLIINIPVLESQKIVIWQIAFLTGTVPSNSSQKCFVFVISYIWQIAFQTE
jgi:hypothetical protein